MLLSLSFLSFGKHGLTLSQHISVDGLQVRVDQRWDKVDHFHVSAHLDWNFFEHFLSEIASCNGFLEADELNDIALGLHIFVVFEHFVI